MDQANRFKTIDYGIHQALGQATFYNNGAGLMIGGVASFGVWVEMRDATYNSIFNRQLPIRRAIDAALDKDDDYETV